MYQFPSSLFFFALGLTAFSAHADGGTGARSSERNSYVIIFRQGPITLTEEEKALRQQAIVAWATKHHHAGHALDPRGLEDDVRRPGVVPPEEGNGTWPIVALVFVEARNIDEAAAIAADHPAKHYNVSTEVRPYVVRKVPPAPETEK